LLAEPSSCTTVPMLTLPVTGEQVDAAADAAVVLEVVALVPTLVAHVVALALALGACTDLAQAISPRAIASEEWRRMLSCMGFRLSL